MPSRRRPWLPCSCLSQAMRYAAHCFDAHVPGNSNDLSGRFAVAKVLLAVPELLHAPTAVSLVHPLCAAGEGTTPVGQRRCRSFHVPPFSLFVQPGGFCASRGAALRCRHWLRTFQIL